VSGRDETLHALARENRLLARKLARLETNMQQMERVQDSNAKLLTNLMHELEEERARSSSLLLNILPEHVIDRLNNGASVIADRYAAVTVLFSDLVGFTDLSTRIPAEELVADLNTLFSEFDELGERTSVEKVKTIGDAYMVVGGLPGTRSDHTLAVAEMALGMVAVVDRLGESASSRWQMRVGVHTGPAVAGVIGQRKFVYDVWGETVNVANRLESTAPPGGIHVSEAVAAAVKGRFDLEHRGSVDLKGVGNVKTFLLTAAKGNARSS
jgi:adenylate cyclase